MAVSLANTITRQSAFNEAVSRAQMRSYHTYFNTHVVEQPDGTFVTIQEADYDTIPMHVIDRITYTAEGRLADEY